ncbi:MAG: hypothetical protein KDA85_05735, partial [Planctomycetaceae bacterium]|nr:hypothetical protein [Planctomycetaceae bacterium]
ITLALMMGLVMFAVIVLVLTGGKLTEPPSLMTWMAVGFGVLMFVNHLVIPEFVAKANLSAITPDSLKDLEDAQRIRKVLPAFQVRHIIGCAMLEGAGFLAAVAALLEKNWIPLAVAGAMIVLMALQFPGETRVRFWAEDKVRERMLN